VRGEGKQGGQDAERDADAVAGGGWYRSRPGRETFDELQGSIFEV
jgi:hypothetical protein